MKLRSISMSTAALALMAAGVTTAPAAQAADSEPLEGVVSQRISVAGVGSEGVLARAGGAQCLFDFKAYYHADRTSITGSTSEDIKGQVVRASGACGKSSVAKTKATVRLSHTGIPPFGSTKTKQGSKTTSSAPFFASVAKHQDVGTGTADFHGPGTQITFDFVWDVYDDNGYYVEFCRRVTGLVKPTSVSKNGDTGLKSCGGGRWK